MRTIYTPAVINKATEDKLWESGVIVFDTCALLDFYEMTEEYQGIVADILKYLSNRVWLPAQVAYEYEKNRKSAILKPISEVYSSQIIEKNGLVKDLKGLITQWEDRNYHPYINDAKVAEIKKALEEIEPNIAKIKEIVSQEYRSRAHDIQKIPDNDKLAIAIRALKKGEAFTFDEIKDIVSEGEWRYARQIGPGYMDAIDKKGVRQYGDLIIWKEILRYAKAQQCDVILVTSETKPDWVVVDETKEDKTADKPFKEELGHLRRDLLTEFEEVTGQIIWKYSPTEFTSKLAEIYHANKDELQFYGALGMIRDMLARAERERELRKNCPSTSLLIRCGACGELFECPAQKLYFEWDGVAEYTDRRMGTEALYISNEICLCARCHHHIDLTFKVWEYPEGVIDYQEIDVEGGELDKPIDVSDYIELGHYEECERCGRRAILNDMGLCNDCDREFEQLLHEDD